jgi:hypothetical protein
VTSGDDRGNHSILSEVICETKCAPNGIEPTMATPPTQLNHHARHLYSWECSTFTALRLAQGGVVRL